jgi:hypothetical protein
LGAIDASGRFVFFAPETSATAYSDQYNNTGGRTNTASSVSTPYGFLIASRTASNAHAIYRNGSSIASNTTSGGILPNRVIYVCAFNDTGVANNAANAPIGAYSIGSGLTSTDVANYNTDMQAFQTALSRNV